MPRVLITDGLSNVGVEVLRKAGLEVDLRPAKGKDLLDAMQYADALVVRSATQVTSEVVSSSPKQGNALRLRVVGRAGVGVDNIDTEACKAAGIAVVNAPLAATNAVAELAFSLMLSLARHVHRADGSMRKGEWEKKAFLGTELRGKTLGLVGIGRIGGRVAELSKAFGMSVVAYDPYVPHDKARAMGVDKKERLEEVLAASDYVSIHVALTPETRHLIGERTLEHFRKTAYLINLSRGPVIDTAALVRALKAGQLAGAGLDVYEEEPLPADHELRTLPNVALAPHLGASTREAQDMAGQMVAEQVVKVLKGEKAEHRVV
jgi:D-3-phosphoglycerate dehydrogenase / 2-oxoglutarate reductase